MSFTAKQIAQLNKMNKAAQNVSLGTVVSGMVDNTIYRGSHTVTSGEVSAGSATISITGLSTAPVGFMGNVYRSGSVAEGWSASSSAGNIVLLAGNSGSSTAYTLRTGDRFDWIAF